MPESIFKAGGTLADNDPSYVERLANKFFKAFWPASCATSLTPASWESRRSWSELRNVFKTRCACGHRRPYCDRNESDEIDQWYAGLLIDIARQLDCECLAEEFWTTHLQIGPLNRLVSAIRQVLIPAIPDGARAVIFIDEIDATLSVEKFNTDELFAAIGQSYNNRASDSDFGRITFCLLGVATPES